MTEIILKLFEIFVLDDYGINQGIKSKLGYIHDFYCNLQ